MATLSIPDMSCGHCRAAVASALGSVPGVTAVEVDLAGKTARIEGTAALDQLLAALQQAGYPAAPAG